MIQKLETNQPNDLSRGTSLVMLRSSGTEQGRLGLVWSGLRGRDPFEKGLPLISACGELAVLVIQWMYPFDRVGQERSR